jgi:hypothetical protein
MLTLLFLYVFNRLQIKNAVTYNVTAFTFLLFTYLLLNFLWLPVFDSLLR